MSILTVLRAGIEPAFPVACRPVLTNRLPEGEAAYGDQSFTRKGRCPEGQADTRI